MEEVFKEAQLCKMIGEDDALEMPIDARYINADNIVTLISYDFMKWRPTFEKVVELIEVRGLPLFYQQPFVALSK